MWKNEAVQTLEARLIAAGDAAMDTVVNAVKQKGDLHAAEFVLRSLLSPCRRR